MKHRLFVLTTLLFAAVAFPAAANITSTSLRIEGSGLAVHNDPPVTTGLDIPTTIQTSFGGKQNEQSSAPEGLTAVAELTGPGLETPIPLVTSPGYKFQVPGLPEPGIYYLQNIRLMKGADFLQYATPATTQIIVADLLQTKIKVRQLSPDELRARGIVIDARNFDVYEFSFTFIIDGQEVVIPFPVVVDPRTHEVQPIPGESEYMLPKEGLVEPPRWTPPQVIPLDFGEEGDLPPEGKEPKEREKRAGRPSMPAAIVIPNNIAVLHQFFAVTMMVTNGAPSESAARLENIRATMRVGDPGALRTVKTDPSVTFGTAVPIVDPDSGATFLVSQGRGEAEWTLEGLRPGTHRLDFDLRATLKQPGQEDVALRATPSAAIVIHDPRFNITFSHPDVVRKGIEYSTYAFITNLSDAPRDAKIENFVAKCADAAPDANVCRLSGDFTDLMHFESGQTRLVEYRLRAGVTGQVFATAGTLSDTDVLSADVKLHMGVSPSGIPLSPKTLILPYYAQFVAPSVVSANLELFGLGYSLATAPLTPVTARFPRVIKTDVFTRAVDLSRAGQRIFITNDNAEAKRDSMMHLALELLGNGGYDLRDWDELRRSEESGRKAGASVARELETTGLGNGATMTSFVEDFARVTAYRQGYVLALAHGTGAGDRPYALSFIGKSSGRETKLNNEAASGWTRGLPYSDISSFNGAGEKGELALLGRWAEDVDLKVTPSVNGPYTLDVIYPDAADGKVYRARFSLDGVAGATVILPLTRGASSLNVMFPVGGVAAVGHVTAVSPDTIRILGSRQDMHLDKDGHKVSVLFNRPILPGEGVDLRTRFKGEIDFNRDGVVYQGPRPISAAALQDDKRTVNTTFDHALSVNASYLMEVLPLVDPLTTQQVSFPAKITPKIDNDNPAGVVYGKVLKGDGTAISGADVVIRQYLPNDNSSNPNGMPQFDVSKSDGAFLFEYVRRQIDLNWTGAYRLEAFSSVHGHTGVEGSVRLPGKVHRVNLQFLGRGSAEGRVTYNDGSVVANAKVIIGSTMFDQFRTATTDATGHYVVDDLPVGPLTFSAQDVAGNITFGANEIQTPGQIVTQNLSIYRAPFPGTGRVYGVVRRSDTDAPVAGARVAIFSSGYAIGDLLTDSEGRFDFSKVPAGFITILAAEFTVAPESVALDFDLKADEVRSETVRLFVAPPTMKLVTLTGVVRRERPNAPGTFEVVPGALVKIEGYKLATADSEGKFLYENVPDVLGGADITAYDPVTQRLKEVQLPTLTELGPNHVEITILAFDRGTGTIRVRLLNAAGKPVPNYRVIEPGFPPDQLTEVAPGIYEMHGVGVGGGRSIWAVPSSMRPESGPDNRLYGDQTANGEAAVLFNGHISALTLRLGGQGTVKVKVRSQFDLISDVNLTYSAWYEPEQHMMPLTLTESTNKNGEADYAVFTKIPAQKNYGFASAHPQYGYAGGSGMLGYDGDLDEHVLQLNTLSKVTGTVYAIDGVTPIAGATVRIYNGRSDPGPQLSGPDGRFAFFDQPSDITVWVTAEVTQGGVYRIGTASANTPKNGGLVENMAVVLRKRGFVDGQVVYKDYKVFDPDNVANNVPDNTPNDYSDNAPVPLARFYLRELDYPGRAFGSGGDPLVADAQGRFRLNNIFTGSLRASAWDPGNEELRGGWAGSIEEEGAEAIPKAYIPIGGGGVGELEVTVRDPNNSYIEVANADVYLFAGGRVWDLTTTGANGVASFDEIPVGGYSVSSYSKALGKSSGAKSVTISRDQTTLTALELEFSGKVQGTLTDPEDGNSPVPGSNVRLTATNYQTQSTTGAAGDFLFNGVRAGTFTLDAKDTDTNRRASATRSISVGDPISTVNLQLEPTETLHFAAYLPTDTGAKSDNLAPPQQVEVGQRCWRGLDHVRHCEYLRQLQGNPIQFPGVFENSGYSIGIYSTTEHETDEAKLQVGGSFPLGSAANPFIYVFPAYGDVKVTVTQGGAPSSGVKCTIYSPEKVVYVYTDATGTAIARGLRLGGIYIQAASSDGRFTGTANVTLERQSVMAQASIALGTYAGVTGKVIAELGGPSVGTRVIAHYNGLVGEFRTDENGSYTFLGIPTSGSGATRVNLTFIGPDDSTLGATTFKDLFAGDGVKTVPDIRIDATPPSFESISPADGAINVSPDASIKVAFSEPLNMGTVNPSTFQLVATDGSGNVNCAISTTTENGLFTVVMKPPQQAGSFPLKSNLLYRVIVTNSVRDLTGHQLPGTLGFSFTTSDYTEPRVLKVLPLSPIPKTTTFEFRFNEPIDPAPWEPGGNGVHHVYKLAAPGGAGAAVLRELTSNTFLDPYNMILFIGLDDAANNRIEPESFYRVVFNGVKDLQGNAMAEQTNHFTSFDEVAPHITFDSPAQTETLITGSEYEITLGFHNGANGPVANDIKEVRFFTFDANGEPKQFAFIQKAPFTIKVVGPDAPPTGTTYKIGAQARDTSGNEGPLQSATWTVRQNAAPTNVVVTPLQTGQYPTKKVQVRVRFEDEGSFASVTATFSVLKNNGTTDVVTVTKEVHRLSSGLWEDPLYEYTLPSSAKAGELVNVSVVVSDVRGLTAPPAAATIAVLADTVQPQILLVSPPAGTGFQNTQKYTIEATVSDADTGVESVAFLVDGTAVATASSTVQANGTVLFRSVQVETKAKAEDANIPIVVTAKDYAGNTKSTTYEVLYRGVNDPDAPKVMWLCPSDLGALPADTAIPFKLRIRAIDTDIRTVKFKVGTTEYTGALIAGTTNEYGITISNFTAPAGPLDVRAIVEDTVVTHTVELPITLDVITADFKFSFTQAITVDNVGTYTGKTIAVLSGGVLAPQVPVTLANLIVLNGGKVETPFSSPTREVRAEITTTGVTYIDCDSFINVNERGYVGGWNNTNGDVNTSGTGYTVGNTKTGGTTDGAQPSHAGLGGIWLSNGFSNAPYGSIKQPVDLGSGGSGSATNSNYQGARGGGAVRLHGGMAEADVSRIVMAGKITANGGDGSGGNTVAAGTGGSVWIEAKQVLFGPAALISANGGDDGSVGGPISLAAGGGRIAVAATTKLDLNTAVLEARGGYIDRADNDTTAGSAGAGTLYIRKPGQEAGELTVSAYDSRHPASQHWTRPTPVGRIAAGTSTALAANALTDASRTFDRWMIGEDIVLAGDQSKAYTVVAISPDGKTLQTDPADGSMLAAAGTQTAAYVGRLSFDKVTAGPDAFLVFDGHVSVHDVLNDKTAMVIDPTAAVLLRGEEPVLTFTSTPAAGGSIVKDTSLSVTYSIAATGGARTVKLAWSPEAPAERTDDLPTYPNPTPSKNLTLPVPAATPTGPATLTFTVTDRVGRTYTLPARTYQIADNAPPTIASFTITPDISIHAGRDVVATVNASDDISVKSITFDAILNGTSIKTQTVTPNTPTASSTFTVTVDPTVAGGSTLQIKVTVSDGFAGRAPLVATQNVTILQDTVAPTVSIVSPAAGTSYRESVDKIPVRITAVDGEVKVKEAYVQIAGGTPVALTQIVGTSDWKADVFAPPVDGDQPVQSQITMTAKDYAGNARTTDPISLTFTPVVDASAPILTWTCASPGAMLPVNTAFKLRVTAVPVTVNGTPNPVQAVEMYVGESTTSLTVTSLGSNLYEATYTIPAGTADGTVTTVRAIARSAGGAASDLVTSFTAAVVDAPVISSSTTIDAANTTYDAKTVLITGGTVTIRGTHSFNRLLILGGNVVHVKYEKVDITTTGGLYVGCLGSIDVTGIGYGQSETYLGERAPAFETGASHIGRGGSTNGSNLSGSTYGSIYRPLEAGGGGEGHPGPGGGVVRIQGHSAVVDGAIKAAGVRNYRGGAGGSIWITTGKVGGGGTIDASGATSANYGGGGGGAVAIEYTDPASKLPPVVRSSGGRDDTNLGHRHGGAGSIYVRGPQSVYGDLTLDSDIPGYAELPSFGSGTAEPLTAVATVVTTKNIQPYFQGHWVEISTAAGTLKGTWRISGIAGKNFTLAPNGGETIDVQPGDKWQGVYRFDNVNVLRGGGFGSADPIRVTTKATVAGPTDGNESYIRTPLDAPIMNITGGKIAAHQLSADAMTLAASAIVTHPTFYTGIKPGVTIEGRNTFVLSGTVDVTTRGYWYNNTYPGERAAAFETGGSHMGRGGSTNGSNLSGSTFGSVYRPREAGGAGDYHEHYAGGVIRIKAGTLLLDGAVRSNASRNYRGGSGGSVWVTTTKVTGSGSINVDGQGGNYGAGGGGAISVEYTDPTSVLPVLSASGGRDDNNIGYRGAGAGTIYVRGAQSTYGDLIVDNAVPDAQLTELPSMGNGTVLSVTGAATILTNRSADWPIYFEGHWVEISDSTGTLKGTWRVLSVSGKSFTLAPNGTETISVQTGDKWQGVYRFDKLEMRRYARISSGDPIRGSDNLVLTGPTSSELFLNVPVSAKNVTIAGRVSAYEINADDMTIAAGAVVTHPTIYSGIGRGVTLNVKNTLTLNGSIDVTTRGYTYNYTYPGERAAGFETGGSHMGRGGSRNGSNLSGSTFGSVYRPREAGGAGDYHEHYGGGIVRITAGTLLVNGSIRSNASRNYRGGSGGSVWITAGRIAGAGTINTDGQGGDYGAGGGGAISIEYTDPASVLPSLSNSGGRDDSNITYRSAGAGTIYVRGPQSVYGDLIVDNAVNDGPFTELPSMGSGTVLSVTGGATVLTNRSADWPVYFEGHWVEIKDAAGTLKGTWRVLSVSGKSFTLAPNGTETISVQTGDKWQGVYRFDKVELRRWARVDSIDPFRDSTSFVAAGPTSSEAYLKPALVTKNATVTGRVAMHNLTADDMTIASGAVLTHPTIYSGIQPGLSLDVKNTLTVNGSIDVSTRGYWYNNTYPGERAAGFETGGSHMGRGGSRNGSNLSGSTFGSVYRPGEAGGAGDYHEHYAGGIIRIKSGTLLLSGSIRSNANRNYRGGSGGSVWIATGKVSGGGVIEANGMTGDYGSGGGGAISLEYTDATSVLPTMTAFGGRDDSNVNYRNAAAGTIYLKGPSATYGELQVINNISSTQATQLPSLGRGNAIAGSNGTTVVTDLGADIQPYFAGHWVDILSPSGTLEGSWRIATINGRTFTLEPNGSSSASVEPGDLWRGVYLFDLATVRGSQAVQLLDELRGSKTIEAGSSLTINDPPLVNPGSISVQSLPDADYIVGAIGAVQDLHQPVVVTLINNRTGAAYPSFNAASDGSFRYAVAGNVGDTFSIRARDSFSLAATSRTYLISGAIVATNGIESLAVTPYSVIGGGSATGTVRMRYPIRHANDATVTLLSSRSEATVPASVTIPVGMASVSFPIATTAVSQDTPVQITASAGTTQGVTANFDILSGTSALTDLQLSETTVEGGTSINGTASISAPSTDGIVYLRSSNPQIATVPEYATIASGQTSVTFTVTTYGVTATSNFSITASHGGSSMTRQASLSKCTAMGAVTPPAAPPYTMWIDDSLPGGPTPTGTDGTLDTTQAASGSASIHLSGAAAGTRSFAFTGGTALAVAPSDNLVLYALINPCNPPRQVVATWTAGTTEYVAAWGESRLLNASSVPYTRRGTLPRGGQWVRLDVLASSIGFSAASTSVTGFSARAVDGEAWIDAVGRTSCSLARAASPSDFPENESIWIDDTLPAGATTVPAAGIDSAWQWSTAQAVSGMSSHVEPTRAGTHQHEVNSASTPLTAGQGDILFAYVLIDPCNPPRQLMLQWYDGTWDHRAYWGENVIPSNLIGSTRTHMGPMPEAGKWVRLDVPATAVNLVGRGVTGMGFTLYDGQAWFDRVGKVSRVNVALKKNATQSSNYTANDPASLAVDGNLTSAHGFMSVTAYSALPSWEVDLGAVYPIDGIDIYGRTDGYQSQSSSFHVFVSDAELNSGNYDVTTAQAGVSSYGFPGTAGAPLSMKVNRTGRYVRIHKTNTDNLTLPEVQVWTPSVPMRVNLAGGRTTSTSANSQYDGWTYPHFAVNGAVSGYTSGGSIYHVRSNGQTDAYWQVDLGSVQPIGSIEMFARTDCCIDQMGNLYVFVSDGELTSTTFAGTRDQAGVSMYYQPYQQWSALVPVERTGRYVRIQKPGTNATFSFSEIFVWGSQPVLPAYSKNQEPAPGR